MAPRFLVDISPLRRFPQFRRLWLGYALRQLGAQLTATTVLFQVFKITHSNLAVGMISVAQVVPGVIVPIFGGAVADAIDRRRLLVITAVLMAITTAGLAVNSIGNRPALWVLYFCSAATWGLSGIDQPTRAAVQMTLVDRDSYVAANSLRQLLQQVSIVAGPSVAGVLIAVFSHDIDIVYWIDVASTLAALQAVLRLDAMPPQGGGRKFGLRSIAEGFQFLKGRQVIQACFITDINATLLGLPTALFPYMATVHYHGGAKTFGLLTAAPGMGAFVGSLLSGWTNRIRYQGRAVLISVVIWGIAIAAFGVVAWLALGLVLLAIAGWADVVSATLRNTIIQVETPDHLRGRLSAFQTASVQTGRLGNAESGLVAAVSSAQISIVSGGLGCALGVLVIAKLIPRFARYRFEASETPAEAASASRPPEPGGGSGASR